MKRSGWRYPVQMLLFIGLLAISTVLFYTLYTAHQAACPQDAPSAVWFVGLCLLLVVLLSVTQCVCGHLSGYTLRTLRLLFLRVEREEGLRVHFTLRPGLGISMLPPRTNGTSPCRLYLCSGVVHFGTAAAAFAVLTAVLWPSPAAALMLQFAFALVVAVLVITVLPLRNGRDLPTLLTRMRNPDLRRAQECALCLNDALRHQQRLADMPDEWFLPYPAELMDDATAATMTVNISSRLIRQQRFPEAWAEVCKLLPRTRQATHSQQDHMTNACTLLNGALCEALLSLPPDCLNRLDAPAVTYMLPDSWRPRRTLARYARALLIDRDEAAAAACLQELHGAEDNEALLPILQAKAAQKE